MPQSLKADKLSMLLRTNTDSGHGSQVHQLGEKSQAQTVSFHVYDILQNCRDRKLVSDFGGGSRDGCKRQEGIWGGDGTLWYSGGGGGTNACVRVKNHRTVCYKGVNSIACKLHCMQMMPGRGNSICKGPEV